MSARAARPRSRRGRQPPPVELAPVVEISEEVVEGANQEGCLEARVTTKTIEQESRCDGDPVGLPISTPELAQEASQAPPEPPKAEDVFETLQSALSSLEAAVAAWHQPPEQPTAGEVGDGGQGDPGPCGGQEGLGGFQGEVAQLVERNGWLRLALGSRERELSRVRGELQAVEAEKETLQREVRELQGSLLRLPAFPPPARIPGAPGSGSGSSSPEADGGPWGAQGGSGTQMVGPLRTQSMVLETQHMETRQEQLRGNIEKLKCFNRLLAAVLRGSKDQCERLSMQLSRREAEATALRLALQFSESCEAAYGALLPLLTPGPGAEVPGGYLDAAQKEVRRLLLQEQAAQDTGSPQDQQPSPEGSSVDRPEPWELAAQLRGCIGRLRARGALVRVPPEPRPPWAPLLTVMHAEAMVQAVLDAQPGPALPRLERRQLQQDLVATREALADLALSLQLARREKRSLELREAAVRALGPAHGLLLEQLRWERGQGAAGGDSSGGEQDEEDEEAAGCPAVPGGLGTQARDPEELAQELTACRARNRLACCGGTWHRLQRKAVPGGLSARSCSGNSAGLTGRCCSRCGGPSAARRSSNGGWSGGWRRWGPGRRRSGWVWRPWRGLWALGGSPRPPGPGAPSCRAALTHSCPDGRMSGCWSRSVPGCWGRSSRELAGSFCVGAGCGSPG
ncbi:harmonin-binding protein USHBP1 isoform X2 [Erinaceus europaeus]|uniref:Harmonin-binding protein USHBP1 isoform X2 n=1 Tax=Erinaceus europaeus TaxID=9365 RepID=A0ABM3WP09_ERIEU|nr:harmonin-binding protein USHBP1 isoform X2 [Erinaceus europaeus]